MWPNVIISTSWLKETVLNRWTPADPWSGCWMEILMMFTKNINFLHPDKMVRWSIQFVIIGRQSTFHFHISCYIKVPIHLYPFFTPFNIVKEHLTDYHIHLAQPDIKIVLACFAIDDTYFWLSQRRSVKTITCKII